MRGRKVSFRVAAMSGCAVLALATSAAAAQERKSFAIEDQELLTALNEFAQQSDRQLLFSTDVAELKRTKGVTGVYEPEAALSVILADTGLNFRVMADDTILIDAPAPVGEGEAESIDGRLLLAQADADAPGTSTGRTREKIIVTGQKREEYIQDVPIAISAFSQEDLTTAQIAGGPDLVTQIPNFTFTKTNFSGYSIQIRGIGTQAISATTDPAVAVAFNNTPFIRNRFFEQEFYDMERVEVLRGPQGTLYGRNATGGVVNLITAKPVLGEDEAKASIDLGNYNSQRLEAMVNIPVVDDQVALRLAGAWTKRDGYATNGITGNPIDGRDLWSTRLSLRLAPNDRLDANLIWEHFEENDDRLRSGKQLCKKDVVFDIGGVPITNYYSSQTSGGQTGTLFAGDQAVMSQGCKRNSLYAQNSFQRPNGLMLPYYLPLGAVGLPTALKDPYVSPVLLDSPFAIDPHVVDETNDQPEDWRVIESTTDPEYRAKTDIAELQLRYELTDSLTLESESAYGVDYVFSLQDFNRFNTAPGAWSTVSGGGPSPLIARGVLDEDGVFCDPQLGCSDRLVAVDLSTAEAWQFSQEFRLSSAFSGPFNFSLGANYLRADSEDKYYVFINSLSLIAADGNFDIYDYDYVGGETDNIPCLKNGPQPGDPDKVYGVAGCAYLDPNPIGSLNDEGHNYFLSRNPYSLVSYAAFGEAYYNLTPDLKITAGLRYTVDKKKAPRIPTWLLANNTVGLPVADVINQEWKEPTGRLAIDWKPDLSFTEDTLLYGSYAHGYKAGGANPPGFVRVFYAERAAAEEQSDASATRPRTFEPEYVDAFEVGSKNTFLGGDVTLNVAAFYYDYEGYQVSEIVDRSAFNRNFDAEVWGAEIEAEWWALENLRLSFKGGYEKTRIADGEQAVDLMDRTAGNEDWLVVRPFPTFASSCVLPAYVFVNPDNTLGYVGGVGGGNPGPCEVAYSYGLDPVYGVPGVVEDLSSYHPGYPGFDPATAPNGGEGFFKELGGNELPNAPNYTATVSGDYILPLGADWTLTFHTDLHYQSEAWWRVFQDHEYARLNEYYTMNLAAILASEDGWNIMGYIKNVTDETAITGAFLNSDDTGLTTNIFLTEPRLYGVRVTKDWTGGTFLGSLFDHAERDPNKPWPLTITFGGQVQRWDAPNEMFLPSFTGEFAPPLDVFDEPQENDLDIGDGRDIAVEYRPGSGVWSLRAAARFGETNNYAKADDQWDTDRVCALAGTPFEGVICPKYGDPNWPTYQGLTNIYQTNWADARATEHEDFEIVDFTVGRDVGLGGLSRSTISGGVRYAQLTSKTDAMFNGVPDWDIPDEGLKYPFPGKTSTRSQYHAEFNADRSFEGVGPMISWDAGYPLVRFDAGGRFDVVWKLSGGVLFGDQDATVTAFEVANMYEYDPTTLLAGVGNTVDAIPLPSPDPIDIERSDDVTVPMLEGSLGLSYEVDRFKIGAGYRWERYYDAIDGGITERDTVDRTIDGPYFNVSIGFGG